MLTELGIYAIFVAIEVVVVTIVSGLNYVAWLDDEHERTGLPHGQLFNWFGFTREFGRAQTIGFGFGLLAFSLSATVVSITLIKEALLSIGVSCLSAHFHRDISHFLRESLPNCMGRFFNRRLSVPFESTSTAALKQVMSVESRADHQESLQAQLQQLHYERAKLSDVDKLKAYKLTELERALILETRAEEKFRLQQIIQELRSGEPD